MFIPFFSRRKSDSDQADAKKLYRRKGGGGGGRGGGGSGGRSGSSGGRTGSGSTGKTGSSSTGKTSTPKPSSPFSSTKPVTVGGSSKKSTSYGYGGGSTSTIPAGQPFAGRSFGGGNRNQIFGTRMYGSGYPGVSGRGVAGRGLPFFFWPIAWGGATGLALGSVSHRYYNDEYGRPDNTSRPGGALYTAQIQSKDNNATTLRIVADNSTVTSLLADINRNCTTYLASSSQGSSQFNGTADRPKPEQVVQYYRASSVALTLDGYNNSAVFSSDDNAKDTELPSGLDAAMINCVNQTIGVSVPLIESAAMGRFGSVSSVQIVGMVWLVWLLSRLS